MWLKVDPQIGIRDGSHHNFKENFKNYASWDYI